MAGTTTSQIRNVVLAAHNGAGKTSLADALYFTSGATNRQGRVDDRTSCSDFEPEEQKRGCSIQTALLPCEWNDCRVNLLDTPGYPDFRGEQLSAMRVADAALIVISATAGLEVGALQAWQMCDTFGLPRAIVVNKLDRDDTDFDGAVAQVADLLGRRCVPTQIADGTGSGFKGMISLLGGDIAEASASRESLVEAISESDDELLARYLDSEEITDEQLMGALRIAFAAQKIVPVFGTSAANNAGTAELLDWIVDLFPSPAESPAAGVADGAQANLVFKTVADPFVGKLSFFRVYGAPLTNDIQLWNSNTEETERLGQIYRPSGRETIAVDEVVTGDIGVVSKLLHTHTFDTLCTRNVPVKLDAVELPEPVFSLAVTPQSQADLDKMAGALARMTEEDPTLLVERSPETRETLISGLGDIHVEMAVERIHRKFDVQLVTSLPKIPYRETITTEVRAEYRHKKQSGGRGQYGHVVLEMGPLDDHESVEFSSRVVGGSVPKEYIPAVEKGVRNAAAEGVLAGYPVVGVNVVVVDGSSHSVDSSSMAFEIAGSMAFRQGVHSAHPTLLEPVMKAIIVVPEECAGDIMGDLNTRRARIHGMQPGEAGFTQIIADAPMSTMQRYSSDLRSLTRARGKFSVTLSHYDVVPPHEADKLLQHMAVAAGTG
ncbi:MAG: elongation factor G [Dehalococcoidia bacterium]